MVYAPGRALLVCSSAWKQVQSRIGLLGSNLKARRLQDPPLARPALSRSPCLFAHRGRSSAPVAAQKNVQRLLGACDRIWALEVSSDCFNTRMNFEPGRSCVDPTSLIVNDADVCWTARQGQARLGLEGIDARVQRRFRIQHSLTEDMAEPGLEARKVL